MLLVDDTSQTMSHATSVTEALHLAQSVRTTIAEGVIGAPPQTVVWILSMLIHNLGMTMNSQLTIIPAVHLLSVTKMIASQAPVTRVQIFSSLVFILVSPKQKSLVFSRNTAMSKVVRS